MRASTVGRVVVSGIVAWVIGVLFFLLSSSFSGIDSSAKKETAGACPAVPCIAVRRRLELVLHAQHDRPAGDSGVDAVAVVLLDAGVVGGAGEVVDVLAGLRVDARVVGHAAGGEEAVVVDQ